MTDKKHYCPITEEIDSDDIYALCGTDEQYITLTDILSDVDCEKCIDVAKKVGHEYGNYILAKGLIKNIEIKSE